MKKHITLFAFISFSFVFLIQAQHLYAQSLEKELEAEFMEAIKAAENLDYDKLNLSVSDHNKAGFIVAANYYPSFDELMKTVRTNSRGVKSQKINLSNNTITVLSQQIGLITASGTTEVILENGQSFSVPFFWTFVYEKINGTWKVVHSHQSNARL